MFIRLKKIRQRFGLSSTNTATRTDSHVAPHKTATCGIVLLTHLHKTSPPCALRANELAVFLLPERCGHRPRKYDGIASRTELRQGRTRSQSEQDTGAPVMLASIDSDIFAGSGDSLTLGLAAQMRKPPSRQSKLVTCLHDPSGSILGDSCGNTSVFSRWS